MDDFIGALVGTVFGIALLVAFGAVIAAGWLLFKFCELVMPPLFEAIGEGCDAAGRRIAAWWREVTWKRRTVRAHNETIRAIETTRREHVAMTRALIEAMETRPTPTATRTTAVRSAVRVAVQPR